MSEKQSERNIRIPKEVRLVLARFVNFVVLPDQEANTVSKVLFDETDQGANFTVEVFRHVCKVLKMKGLQMRVYHPQSNAADR